MFRLKVQSVDDAGMKQERFQGRSDSRGPGRAGATDLTQDPTLQDPSSASPSGLQHLAAASGCSIASANRGARRSCIQPHDTSKTSETRVLNLALASGLATKGFWALLVSRHSCETSTSCSLRRGQIIPSVRSSEYLVHPEETSTRIVKARGPPRYAPSLSGHESCAARQQPTAFTSIATPGTLSTRFELRRSCSSSRI